jgi:hypothetical protein
MASDDLTKWREMFLAVPPRGDYVLIGAIADELGREPDDVLESLRAGRRMGWDRVGRSILLHSSQTTASAPASSVRVWLGTAGEAEQLKERRAQ